MENSPKKGVHIHVLMHIPTNAERPLSEKQNKRYSLYSIKKYIIRILKAYGIDAKARTENKDGDFMIKRIKPHWERNVFTEKMQPATDYLDEITNITAYIIKGREEYAPLTIAGYPVKRKKGDNVVHQGVIHCQRYGISRNLR